MNKIKIIILGFLIINLNSSCSEKFATTEMKNNFTAEQIEDLMKMRDFFKTQICEK